MATNLVAPGKVFDVVAPTGGYISGNAYLVGDLLMIALYTVVAGKVCSMAATGVYSLPKTAAGSGAAITQGSQIYWDDTAKAIVNTSASGANKWVGWAYAPAVTTATTVQVKLLGGNN